MPTDSVVGVNFNDTVSHAHSQFRVKRSSDLVLFPQFAGNYYVKGAPKMDTKSAPVIYRVFHFLLHGVFSILSFFVSFGRKFKNKFGSHEISINKIEKIPKHLTVLLGDEEPSVFDLANLILWCLTAQIAFISFYDSGGVLKKHQDKLHRVVAAKKRESDHVIWHSHPDQVYRNGFTGRKIHVKVLSREDGREDVVDYIKKLSMSGSSDFDIDTFDVGLRKRFEFPDPELAVCCGKTFSLSGYPPWQIRVTEFLRISSHHDFSFDKFVEMLIKFNKCEQRFGK